MKHRPVVWHVDDLPADLDAIALALGSDLVRLRSFNDPLDARDALVDAPAEDLPDLLLLDVNMPGLDGFQFVRLVHADPRLAQMRVCVLSGGDVLREHDALRRLGTADVLHKPQTFGDFPALKAAVCRLLGLPPAQCAQVLSAAR